MTESTTTRYKVESTQYTDVYGNILWAEPMMFNRLWKVNQTFIYDFIEYRVVRVAVVDKTQVVNVEVV